MRLTWILFALTLGSCASPAFAQSDLPGTTRLWSEGQILTRAAPTLVTEGLSLRDVAGFRVTVCAEATRTLSGAGTLLAYVWDNALAAWVRNKPLDLALASVETGVRCAAFPDFETTVASGRVLYATSAVTVSAGTTATVQIKAWTKRGQ